MSEAAQNRHRHAHAYRYVEGCTGLSIYTCAHTHKDTEPFLFFPPDVQGHMDVQGTNTLHRFSLMCECRAAPHWKLVICCSWIADNNDSALWASEAALCVLGLVHLCAPVCCLSSSVMDSTSETCTGRAPARQVGLQLLKVRKAPAHCQSLSPIYFKAKFWSRDLHQALQVLQFVQFFLQVLKKIHVLVTLCCGRKTKRGKTWYMSNKNRQEIIFWLTVE